MPPPGELSPLPQLEGLTSCSSTAAPRFRSPCRDCAPLFRRACRSAVGQVGSPRSHPRPDGFPLSGRLSPFTTTMTGCLDPPPSPARLSHPRVWSSVDVAAACSYSECVERGPASALTLCVWPYAMRDRDEERAQRADQPASQSAQPAGSSSSRWHVSLSDGSQPVLRLLQSG